MELLLDYHKLIALTPISSQPPNYHNISILSFIMHPRARRQLVIITMPPTRGTFETNTFGQPACSSPVDAYEIVSILVDDINLSHTGRRVFWFFLKMLHNTRCFKTVNLICYLITCNFLKCTIFIVTACTYVLFGAANHTAKSRYRTISDFLFPPS